MKVANPETALPSKLPTGDMRYMVKDRNSRIWLSYGGDVLCYSPDGQRLLHTSSFPEGIACLFEIPGGPIVVGVKKLGFFKIESLGAKPIRYIPELKNTDGTYALSIDSNSMWLGTDKGLYKHDCPTKNVRLIDGTEKFYIRSIQHAK